MTQILKTVNDPGCSAKENFKQNSLAQSKFPKRGDIGVDANANSMKEWERVERQKYTEEKKIIFFLFVAKRWGLFLSQLCLFLNHSRLEILVPYLEEKVVEFLCTSTY